jgi:hypothetical protein
MLFFTANLFLSQATLCISSGSIPGLHRDLGSDQSLKIVDEWIEKCDRQHKCYQGHQTALPTRVIDVSQEDPRLVISNEERSPYITLSHCWGGEQPITTTISTLDERIAKIPMDSLPALYRDAVKLTRHLGIKYLWIDSLCIVQDCQDDWRKESAKMGEIYRLSYLTLYALSSPNCHQGILVERESLTETRPDPSGRSAYNQRAREEVFKDAPLCQRAWALQERLLSPRLLHYSREEMFWECLACTARESSHRISLYRPGTYKYERYECPQVKIPLVLPLEENPSFPVSLPSDWHTIVAEYTRCQLTQSSDKLPAISGLASVFQRNTGYTYLAGLWEEELANGLLWFCITEQDRGRTTKPRTGPYRGPSWSWVSTDLAVRNRPWRSQNSRGTDIELIKSNVQLAGPDPKGEILFASITIKAHFYKISYESEVGSRKCSIYDTEGSRFGRGILDASDEEPGVRRQCAAICVRQQNSVPIFLIVIPAQDTVGENCWRRIGIAWANQFVQPAPEKSVVQLV